MCKQLTFLISAVLTFGFALSGSANAQEPGLVGWWTLDRNANDSSGNNNHGTLFGNPQWVAGKIGGALDFDGTDDYVETGTNIIPSSGDFTIGLWLTVDSSVLVEDDRVVVEQGPSDPSGARFYIYSSTDFGDANGQVRVWSDPTGQVLLGPDIRGAGWKHLVLTRSANDWELYVDGTLYTTASNANSIPEGQLILGGGSVDGRYHFGQIDDVRIYNRALTAEEVVEVMRGPLPPALASGPIPDKRATDVDINVTLEWTPGVYAAPVNGHTIYLSENFDDVNDGIGGIRQSADSYTPPQPLEYSTTYYWRVDEVNAAPSSTVYKGAVWSFTTEPVAYRIENITATASSSSPGRGPENTINGSGLDDNDLHSTVEEDMWLSGTELNAAWIQYEFDKVYSLYQMLVWNHNTRFESAIGFGIKEATIEYSVDGAEWIALGDTHEFAQAPGMEGYAYNTTVDFDGVLAKYIRITTSSNFGGLAKQYGLSEVRFFYIPLRARQPYPESGTMDVNPDVILSWRAGREATQHDLYISTDEQAVKDGTAPLTTLTETDHGPLALDLGTTYYWKVNEISAAGSSNMLDGDVWNFTTPEFIVVDDFEDYNDYPPDEIFNTWIDGYGIPGNGALSANDLPPFAETTTVNSGSQAMPFRYDNTGTAAYSETERTFTVAQDWTKHGLKTLSLRFYGSPDNVVGQMYIKVNGAKVVYDGDSSNLTRAGWQAWNIELASFGVDMQNVTSLAIGIDGAGASGVFYVDDIRLFAYERRFVTPTEPDTAGLAAHYTLDGNANDSSGNNNNGTLAGNPQWVTGKIGDAVDLDGRNDYIDCGNGPTLDITGPITISAWVYPTGTGLGTLPRIVDKSNGTGGGDPGFKVYLRAAENYVVTVSGGGAYLTSSLSAPLNTWSYVAFVMTGEQWKLYVNGTWEVWDESSIASSSTNPLYIGNSPAGDRQYDGLIDDVRIYNRALTSAEISWLGGKTEPFEEPF